MANKEIESVILFQLDITNKIAKQFSQREFDRLKLGITVDQWVLLKIIDDFGKLSQIELAQTSVRDPASITRTLDLLEKKGFVQRNAIVSDRRQYSIELTSEGKKFVTENMVMVKEHRNKSIAGFTNEELNSLSAMLNRIQQNMN
ncbi:MAG TPA: MarR family transcriptional regulator [Fulvivirga sp.]|nr:MarR family transcriptional regulator [Fulvivirga sp.]